MREDIRNKLEEQSKLNHDKVQKDMRAMLTVEERADRYIDNNFTRIAEEMPICEGMKTLYIESATEQKSLTLRRQRRLLIRLVDGLQFILGTMECLKSL